MNVTRSRLVWCLLSSSTVQKLFNLHRYRTRGSHRSIELTHSVYEMLYGIVTGSPIYVGGHHSKYHLSRRSRRLPLRTVSHRDCSPSQVVNSILKWISLKVEPLLVLLLRLVDSDTGDTGPLDPLQGVLLELAKVVTELPPLVRQQVDLSATSSLHGHVGATHAAPTARYTHGADEHLGGLQCNRRGHGGNQR
jgi:hypothetical protein